MEQGGIWKTGDQERKKALDELMILEQNTEGKQMSTVEASQMTRLRAEIQQLAKIEEISWRQKFRCLWVKEGDRYTKYFQKIANSNRRSNCIDRLLVDNVVIEDKETIKKEKTGVL